MSDHLLPVDLWQIIGSKLESEGDRVRFRAVCKSWMSLLPSRQPPWLLLPEENPSDPSRRSFICLGDEQRYNINLPELHERHCIGSSGNWLITVHMNKTLSILNPFSKHQIHLPSFPFETVYDDDEEVEDEDITRCEKCKIVLSSSPCNSECIALWFHFQFFALGIARPGDASWTFVQPQSYYSNHSLPGGMPGASTLRDCQILQDMVKKQATEGRIYAAVCAAPAVALGSWGLLKGLKATCYPSFMEKLPSDTTAVESRVVHDGQTVTSRGPGTTMEFALALVERLYGKEKADEVAGPMVMRPNHGKDYTINELNSVKWTFNSTPQILVPIAHGTEEMEAVMIIDILRRAKATVVVASVEDKLEIVASRNVKLVADMSLEEAAKLSYDLIVLPGGLPGAQTFSDSEKLVNLLKKQMELNKPYGAICASPALVLEPHGLLKSKKATAFPAMCSKLSDQSEAENRVVIDGNIVTSRGPGTSMEFSLAIVEKFFGHEKASELAKTMVFTSP